MHEHCHMTHNNYNVYRLLFFKKRSKYLTQLQMWNLLLWGDWPMSDNGNESENLSSNNMKENKKVRT